MEHLVTTKDNAGKVIDTRIIESRDMREFKSTLTNAPWYPEAKYDFVGNEKYMVCISTNIHTQEIIEVMDCVLN